MLALRRRSLHDGPSASIGGNVSDTAERSAGALSPATPELRDDCSKTPAHNIALPILTWLDAGPALHPLRGSKPATWTWTKCRHPATAQGTVLSSASPG